MLDNKGLLPGTSWHHLRAISKLEVCRELQLEQAPYNVGQNMQAGFPVDIIYIYAYPESILSCPPPPPSPPFPLLSAHALPHQRESVSLRPHMPPPATMPIEIDTLE